MSSFLSALFDTSDFPARWNCGNWSTAHGLTHIVADFAIAGAYAAIPLALAYVVIRRRDVPFLPLFWLFVAFICSCGLGHFVEATIFWHPWYRLSALVKVCTAVISWITALAMFPILPRALALPGLKKVNEELKQEAARRQEAQQKLQESYDELHEFTQTVMEREERMIELKQEVNSLLNELGRSPRYSTEKVE